MSITLLSAALLASLAASPTPSDPNPAEIVASAPAADWVEIDPEDLLVMTLAPDAQGRERQVIIQLMGPPFSQGWIGNIRKLAAAHWWDGTSINRVQDNYVVQWGDANSEDKASAKPLSPGLAVLPESAYVASRFTSFGVHAGAGGSYRLFDQPVEPDIYAGQAGFWDGWPVAGPRDKYDVWPVHCYGMVGVGRNLSPDTGSGAELYVVIGHAPRQLDRNIALVGRVIAGIDNLSSLRRGTGDLGFYKTAAERTPIVSIRIASELPVAEQPRFQYLSTGAESFAKYAHSRANRNDAFFKVPAGGADICNIPVPVRPAPGSKP